MARDNSQGQPKFPALRTNFTGNITRDPRKIEGGGNTGASFGIAISSRNYKGEEHTQFANVAIWGYWSGAVLDEYKKGDRVIVNGELFFEEYKDEITWQIEGREIAKVLYPARSGGGNGGGARRNRDDDDEDAPRSSSRRSRRDDDDDDDEAPRRSRRGGGDDDEAPRRSRRGGDDEDGGSRRRRSSSYDDNELD